MSDWRVSKMILRNSLDSLLITLSGAFDARYYLLTYEDIRRADTAPLHHFIKWGWKEGRNPSAAFNTAFYLQTNPDVLAAGVNPLLHYLRHGKKEGRLPRPGTQDKRAAAPNRPTLHGFRSAARKLYRALPLSILQRQRLKAFLLKSFPRLFRMVKTGIRGVFWDPTYTPGNLIDLAKVQPAEFFSKQIAVHMHIFYSDLIPEFVRHIANMPFAYDLYISVVSEDARALCEQAFGGLPHLHKLTVEQVSNRGRDLAPFFCAFGARLKQYDLLAHFHTKKSLYNQGNTLGWREYLLSEMLGSPEQIQRIFSLLRDDSPYGMVYPQTYYLLPPEAHTWMANRPLAGQLQDRLGFEEIPEAYFDFPAGSMFWARKEALTPLFEADFALKDFPEETGQTDGTLAHTLERFLGVSTSRQGLEIAILQDKQNYSWSAWRFDHILQRSYLDLKESYDDSFVKLIGFDVFDTLLCRPLLDPEATKKIVARCSSPENGAVFLRYRAFAEAQARALKGADVGLDETYQVLEQLSGLGAEEISELRALEESVEEKIVRPRAESIQLYQDALRTGKPTIIITDTPLPEPKIVNMLHQAGVDRWDQMFISNSVGARKDSGALYERVLEHYALKPESFVMTGDNECSDFQIPLDRGSGSVHILRPVEIARGMPRLRAMVDLLKKRADLDEELTLGPILLRNFSPLVYPELDPTSLFPVSPENIGYSLIGPLLVSYSQWLLVKAREDAVDHLYFLSREGRLMKAVYDTWTTGLPDTPRSEYLVVSRRCSSMAAVSSFEDILDIAKTTYYPNTLRKLLHTRYGISPSAEKWQQIARAENLGPESIVEIQQKRIGRLEAVLDMLREEINTRAESEKTGLLQQLSVLGMPAAKNPAVADVGYGGSVQGHLNKILGKPVHGYYLLTDERSRRVADRFNVHLRGCFGEEIGSSQESPLIFRYSFDLEKLLSSNDPQIEYYEMKAGQAVGHYRPLADEELAASEIRNQIQAGALQYTADLREIRQTLLPDFQPSCFVATSLMDAFLTNQSDAEIALLSSITLDDYYCGRDLVA